MGDPILGRVLEGRYRVVARLARGGMSTVYSAVDMRLDREVAVKVMSAALSTDPAFADRFAREARVAARLSHPNAVAVFDQGTDGSHVFLVMELVRGRTLRDLIRERGVLTPAQAVSIMEPVLGALAAAHRAGLIHRDIKPENILLADDGAVKVADFGLARAIESDASNTRTGLMMGTVAYCPPEQISRGISDARSDVYSAGVVLFELLTGAAPFTGDSAMSVAYQHVNSDVPAPSTRRGNIAPQLDETVLRATSREPSGRPLDAGAFLAELHDVRLDLGLPVVGVPPRPRQPDPDDTQVIDLGAGRAQQGQRTPGARPAGAGPLGVERPDAGRHSSMRPAEVATAPTHAAMGLGPGHHTAISQRPDAGGPDRSSVPRGPADRRRRARRRTAVWVILILLLGLLTGYGAWWLTVGRYRQVPNVSGLAQSAATQQLVADGFRVDPAVSPQYSETVASGLIIATDPSANAHLLKGRSIRLIVSRGAERFVVPTVSGTWAQAQQTLRALPVRAVRSDSADPTGKIASGSVIRTDPPAGRQVKRDAVITVYVSTGPPSVTVPDVRNQPLAAATATLKQAGFTVNSTQAFSDTIAAGLVISTSPGGSTSAVKFTAVSVVVSEGPELVTLPDIPNGTDEATAKATLQGLGLQVAVRKTYGGFLHVVVAMDPKAGTQVRKGSLVELTVV
jgi:serine/threonine-protein kinase